MTRKPSNRNAELFEAVDRLGTLWVQGREQDVIDNLDRIALEWIGIQGDAPTERLGPFDEAGLRVFVFGLLSSKIRVINPERLQSFLDIVVNPALQRLGSPRAFCYGSSGNNDDREGGA
jgi:hypothetical protein